MSEKRNINFIKQNSLNFSGCQNHVKSLCSMHSIKDCHVKEFVNDEKALFVNNSYVAYLDYQDLMLSVADMNNGGKVVRRFTGATCWHQCLRWLSMQG